MDICLDKEQYVALAAPSSPVASKEDVMEVADYLTNLGFKVIFKEDCYTRMAAKDRAEILLNYLFDSTISTVWAIRGGEGSADIVPYLEPMKEQIKLLKPKHLIGFSDVSALLIYFAQMYGWSVLHGMVATQFLRQKVTEETKEKTLNLICQSQYPICFDELQPLNELARTPAFIEAPIMAANLTMCDLSVRDVWEIDLSGKIFMIEDVSEKGYRLVRLLKYLKRIGLLSNVKAMIYGDFNSAPIGTSEADQETEAFYVLKELREFAMTCDFPVFMTEQFGHGAVNFPIVLNALGKLDVGEQSTLSFCG